MRSGIRPRTRSNGTARTTKSAAICSPVRKTTPLIAPSSSTSMPLTPVVRRTVDVMVAEPALQPGSIELTQGNQGNLRLKARPVPQEPVQENLTGVTDIHLFEPLIEGRDEHGSPEQVDGPDGSGGAAAASRRTTRPAWSSRRMARTARPYATRILSPARQEPGRQKTAGQMERGRPGPDRNREISTVGTQKDQLALAAEHRIDPDPPAEISQVCAAGHADMLAIVDELAGRRVVERAGASAQPGPALEDRDPQAAIDQSRRRRQARQAAADDHDMRRGGSVDGRYHY